MEFSPTIDVHMLAQDINPVRLRFKKPNELLLHQIAHLITGDDVKDLQHVDSTVGGNHGKGQLCMIFNMILCKNLFPDCFNLPELKAAKLIFRSKKHSLKAC